MGIAVAVISYSGNTGKTTVATQLLAPCLGSKILSVETINESDESSQFAGQITGRNIKAVAEAVADPEGIIVDIGASNVESFLKRADEYAGVLDDFDYFVVPTTCEKKQIKDTAQTITDLLESGVPVEKIRLVINRVDEDDDIDRLTREIEKMAQATLEHTVVIPRSDAISDRQGMSSTVFDLAADTTNYMAMAKKEPDAEVRKELLDKAMLHRVSAKTASHLQKVFAEMNLVGA